RRVDEDVGDVLPRERAAQLARADRVIRDAGLRRAARLEAGAAADPLAGDAARAERSGDGEPGRGVAARAAACDDDHLYFASERLRRAPALDGRAIIARGPCRAPALDGRAIIARGPLARSRSTRVPRIPVAFEGERDEALDQLAVGETRGLPEPGIR